MDWITSNIAIGNYLDAQEADLHAHVDAVLCLKENCCDERRTDVEVLCIPLIDGPGNRMSSIESALDFIDDIVSSGMKILVHCHAGRSRSVVIVMRFLMKTMSISRDDALKMIACKRDIYLSDGIDNIVNT